MPITHGWATADSDDPAYDVSADELNNHTGTNDHAHTATDDGGALKGPMTTAGDLMVATTAGVAVRLAKGSDGQVLTVDPTTHLLVWATPAGASFATPAIVLGSAAAAGAAGTVIRSDSTIAAFDATAPVTQAMADAAAVGTAAFAARRDHKHGMPALGTTAAAIGTSAGGSATTPSKSDHVHATGAGTPTTQAFGDSAATGSGPAAAMTDHKHAMMALPAIDATAAATDITTRNVSTTAHGLAPKLPNDATKYLDGTGAYTVPPAASGMTDPMTTRGDIIIRDAANATARLGKGAAATVLTSDGTDVAWAAPAGGLLGLTAYDPGTGAQYSTTTTLADMDATNLAVAFTAPASGNVLVRLTTQAYPTNVGGGLVWGLREGGSTVGTPCQVMGDHGAGANAAVHTISRTFYLSGLSAGAHTYKWAAKHTSNAWVNRWGGGTDGSGAATMEVWAAP